MAEIKSYLNYIKEACDCNLSWDRLQNTNILITGATGLIGSCLVDILMQKNVAGLNVYAAGRNVERASARFKQYSSNKNFHFIKYDVTNTLNSSICFDYIIHAASNASPNFFKQFPVEVIASNIYGVDNLLKYGKEHGMKRFLYVSTGEVYGEGDGRVYREDYSGYIDCTNPRSCYPSSKRAAETLCSAYVTEYGVDAVIARPSHTYGPYFTESDNRVYAQFIRNVLNNEDIILKSTGEQYRSWCFVVDCAQALLYVLLNGKTGEAYNIADATSNITIKQLAEMVAEIGGKKVVMKLPDTPDNNKIITKATFDTNKLQALGWKISGNMKEKMTSTIKESY